MSKQISRKLRALEYPEWQQFIVTDVQQFAALVYWVEAVVIRFYSTEERAFLKLADNSTEAAQQDWISRCLRKYLQELNYHGVERPSVELVVALDWLLTYAIDLEYKDNAQRYNSAALPEPVFPSMESDPVDVGFGQNAAVNEMLTALCRTVGIPNLFSFSIDEPISNEHVLTALYHVVERRYNQRAIKEATETSRDSIDEAFPPGFDTTSTPINRASAILRMLYINDIRELQSNINELIAELMQITAQPSTDVSLGQVGR